MARSPKLELIGAKQLDRTLRTLGPKVGRRVLKKALSAAATPVVKAAKGNVSVKSGLLKKSLGKVVKVGRKSLSGTARVGARNKIVGTDEQGNKVEPWRYSHLVELGHANEHGGHVPAKPFLRPAADETAGQAASVMKDALAAGVLKEAKKG